MKNNTQPLDGAPSGIPPALSEALNKLRDLGDRPYFNGDRALAFELQRTVKALESAILSALPREEPQPAPAECADCGAPMNGGEAATFTVCSTCWDRHYRPAPSGEALEALNRLARSARIGANGESWISEIDADAALIRRALSGLPQPTQHVHDWRWCDDSAGRGYRCMTCNAEGNKVEGGFLLDGRVHLPDPTPTGEAVP